MNWLLLVHYFAYNSVWGLRPQYQEILVAMAAMTDIIGFKAITTMKSIFIFNKKN